jgi:hypothetical protein
VFQITDLTNGGVTTASGTASPVFQYTLSTGSSPVPYSTSEYGTTQSAAWVTDFGANSCTSVSVCPATQIQTVTMDLEVQAPGGQPASYKTTVSALAPYYSKFVG